MEKANGLVNQIACRKAAEAQVKRFVYISEGTRYAFLIRLASVGFPMSPNWPLSGYFMGKKAAEGEVLNLFPQGGYIIRPGLVHG